MLKLDVIINHFWQQIYVKRNNFVIVSLQVLNFILGHFVLIITALLTPADMQSHLNSETKTLDLVAAEEKCILLHTSDIYITCL